MNITININSAEEKQSYHSLLGEKKEYTKRIKKLFLIDGLIVSSLIFIVIFGVLGKYISFPPVEDPGLKTFLETYAKIFFWFCFYFIYVIFFSFKEKTIFFHKKMRRYQASLRETEGLIQEKEMCFLYDYLFAKKFGDVFVEKVLRCFPEIKFE
jgi:amino acid permease